MKQSLLRVALAFSIVAAPAAAQDCQTKSSCCASEAKAQVVVEEKAQCGSKCDAAAKAQVVVEEKAQCGSTCDAAAKAQVVVQEKAECGSSCTAETKAQVVVATQDECTASCEAQAMACENSCTEGSAAELVVDAVADPAAKLHCAQSTLAKAESELATVKARLVSFETKSCSSTESCEVAAAASCCSEQAAATVAEAVTESCCATEMAASCSALPECPVAAYDVVQTRISKTRAHVAANRARLLVARANRQDAAAPLARPVVEEVPAKQCCSGMTKAQG